jgi:hypothetical protein
VYERNGSLPRVQMFGELAADVLKSSAAEAFFPVVFCLFSIYHTSTKDENANTRTGDQIYRLMASHHCKSCELDCMVEVTDS